MGADNYAQYQFDDCGEPSDDLTITIKLKATSKPALPIRYERYLEGKESNDHRCFQRNRLSTTTTVYDVRDDENLFVLFGTTQAHAPGLPLPFKPPVKGKLTISVATLDNAGVQTKMLTQQVKTTGYLSPVDIDYYGRALESLDQLYIEGKPLK